MRSTCLFLCISILAFVTARAAAQQNVTELAYRIEYATYLGGVGGDMPRDMCVDSQGNTYVTGGTTTRQDFPGITHIHGVQAGNMEVFMSKFDPNGQLIWSVLLGGTDTNMGHDRAYACEVDSQGNVYVAGRAGRGFPVTPGAFQMQFHGIDWGGYGGYQRVWSGPPSQTARARAI